MTFNIALIVIIGIVLHFEKKDLNVFGFLPLPRTLGQFVLGLSLAIALSTFVNLLLAESANFVWVRNEDFKSGEIYRAVYNTFNSVLFEELIFRSYALYKLSQLFGEKAAVFSTSIAFGIYHWFTLGALGNYPMMVWIFFFTGLWGVMFAYCYTRTGTILLAIGLHWGWNFFEQLIFTKKGLGVLKALTSDDTLFLNNVNGFLITMLPTILFALIIILYLIKRSHPKI